MAQRNLSRVGVPKHLTKQAEIFSKLLILTLRPCSDGCKFCGTVEEEGIHPLPSCQRSSPGPGSAAEWTSPGAPGSMRVEIRLCCHNVLLIYFKKSLFEILVSIEISIC